tara:strand:- start:5200 stop:5469 length:270 start_codon:yes stop_codon:yes gene_type:complete
MPITKNTYGVDTVKLLKTAKKRGTRVCIKKCKKKYPRGKPNGKKRELCITACNRLFKTIAGGKKTYKKRKMRRKSRKSRRKSRKSRRKR